MKESSSITKYLCLAFFIFLTHITDCSIIYASKLTDFDDLYSSTWEGKKRPCCPVGIGLTPILGGIWVNPTVLPEKIYTIHQTLGKKVLENAKTEKKEKNVCFTNIVVDTKKIPFGPYVSGENNIESILPVRFKNKFIEIKKSEKRTELKKIQQKCEKFFDSSLIKQVKNLESYKLDRHVFIKFLSENYCKGTDWPKFVEGSWEQKFLHLFKNEPLNIVMMNLLNSLEKDIFNAYFKDSVLEYNVNIFAVSLEKLENVTQIGNLCLIILKGIEKIISTNPMNIKFILEDDFEESLVDVFFDRINSQIEKKKKEFISEIDVLLKKTIFTRITKKDKLEKFLKGSDNLIKYAREVIEKNTEKYQEEKIDFVTKLLLIDFTKKANSFNGSHKFDSEQQFLVDFQLHLAENPSVFSEAKQVDFHLCTLWDMCPYCLSSVYLYKSSLDKAHPGITFNFYVSSLNRYQIVPGIYYYNIIDKHKKLNTYEEKKGEMSFFAGLMKSLGPYYPKLPAEDIMNKYVIQFTVDPIHGHGGSDPMISTVKMGLPP